MRCYGFSWLFASALAAVIGEEQAGLEPVPK
jgi:hypothetical protein